MPETSQHLRKMQQQEPVRTSDGSLAPSWTQADRVAFIMDRLLNINSYTRIDDLAALLFVSSRQVSKDLVLVRERLADWELNIRSVPHHGMIVEGSEFDKRLCLSDLYAGDVEYLMSLVNKSVAETAGCTPDGSFDVAAMQRLASERLLSIRGVLTSILRETGFKVSDIVYENLIVHLYIALERATRGLAIGKLPYTEEDEANRVATLIADGVKLSLGVDLSDDERNYIAAHLRGKQRYDTSSSHGISSEVGDLVIDVLEKIDGRYGTDLRSDFQLCMNLSMHFEPMMNRVRLGLRQPNPMLGEIKRTYISEFEMAQEGCREIERRCGCPVPENELGYIALYLRASIEKRFDEHRSQILLVCSTGRGSAELMRTRFQAAFSPYIARLDLCSAREADERNLDEYDFIFTTVPLDVDVAVPVVRVTCFLDGKDMADINGALRKTNGCDPIDSFFSKDLFIPHLRAKTKEDVLRQMVERISAVREVPHGFLESVLKRETLANTCFGNSVAFPHPDEPMSDDTFVCVAVLDKGIDWGTGTKVNLVLLASIENAHRKRLQPLYDCLASVMSSPEGVEAIVKDASFETLRRVAGAR